MDLIKLSDAFSASLESSEELRQLFKTVHIDKLTESKVPLLEPYIAYKALFRWIDLVLYTTCAFLPHMNENNAHNIALGHPIALWLFKYHETIDSCCVVGMILARLVKLEKVPIQVIRLKELTERFKKFILPKMVEYHDASVEEVKQFAPELLNLFSPTELN